MKLLDPPTNTNFMVMQCYGFMVGGMAPIFLYAAVAYFTGSSNSTYSFLTFYSFGLLCLSVIVTYIEKREGDSDTFRTVYSFQAGFCIFLVHLLILYSGGACNSIFSYVYLYLISIIGYTYGRGPNLNQASLAVIASFILNVFFIDFQRKTLYFDYAVSLGHISKVQGFPLDAANTSTLMRAIIFGFQLFISVKIIRRLPNKVSDESQKNLQHE